MFTYDFILAPRGIHRDILILKNEYIQSHTKIIDKNELLTAATFRVDDQAIYELITTFSLSYQSAKNYLKSMYFLREDKAGEKLATLQLYYQHLVKKGLVTFDDTKFFYQNKSVLIINYAETDQQLNLILKVLGLKATYWQENTNAAKFNFRTFSEIGKEVPFVLNQITHLLAEGIPTKDIILLTTSREYQNEMKLWLPSFSLPLNVFSTLPALAFPRVQKLMGDLEDNINQLDEFLHQLFASEHEDSAVIEVLKVLKQYPRQNLDNQLYLELIKDKLSTININEQHYKNAINVVDDFPLTLEGKCVFILGFCKGQYPRVSVDNDFLTDDEKTRLGINTSSVENQMALDLWKKRLNTSNHFYFSYAENVGGQKQLVSELVDLFAMAPLPDNTPTIFYSQTYLNLFYAELRDNFSKYNAFDDNIARLEPLAQSFRYQAFDNQYSPVDHFRSDSFLSLSFSKLDTFYACSFRYYLEYVLKLRTRGNMLSLEIGTLYHLLMEKSDEGTLDVRQEVEIYLAKSELDAREKMIIRGMENMFKIGLRLKGELEEQMTMSSTTSELEVRLKFDDLTQVSGRIDRLYVLKDQGLVLVDYKTGLKKFKASQVEHGKSLQLPLYALLIKKDPRFIDHYIVGLFLQKLKQEGLVYTDDEEAEYAYFKKKFKMHGLLIDDLEAIGYFDHTALEGSSHYVTGLGYSKKEARLRKKSPVYDASFFDEIAQSAKDKILEAATRIRQNDFRVNPLIIDKESACDFCPFSAICFKKDDDYRRITTQNTSDEEDEEDGTN